MTSLLLGVAAPVAKATAGALKSIPLKVNQPPLQVQPGPAILPHGTWIALHAGWLTHTLAGIFLVSSLSLIVLLAAQTTKQEGLSGTLGGRVESAYGRPGAEEQLKRITGVAATFFVICGTILALTGI